MQLIKWLKHYIQFKDCVKKQIVDIKEETDKIIVTEKKMRGNKTISDTQSEAPGKENKTYFVHDELGEILSKTGSEKTYFVCLNSKKNIKTLLDNWDSLIANKSITILFAHPGSNEVWLINPAAHHKITEKESLKEGIESLHSSIQKTN